MASTRRLLGPSRWLTTSARCDSRATTSPRGTSLCMVPGAALELTDTRYSCDRLRAAKRAPARADDAAPARTAAQAGAHRYVGWPRPRCGGDRRVPCISRLPDHAWPFGLDHGKYAHQ